MAKRYTYTIDENNAVSIIDTENPNEDGSPNLFQPGHPTAAHEPWESVEAATAWAEETIEHLIDPPAVFYPAEWDTDEPRFPETGLVK